MGFTCMSADCKCHIYYGAGKGGNKIVRCPLHDAALDLLEVARYAMYEAYQSAHSSGDPNDEANMTGDAILCRMAKAAIAKAEGQ
jgi:hypothetical protein